MRISYTTFDLLCELGDSEALFAKECNEEQECHASKYCEGRIYFRFFSKDGEIRSEGHDHE